MRNKIIDNHVRAVNLAALGRSSRCLGGIAGRIGRILAARGCRTADIDLKAVEVELVLNAVLLRDNLIHNIITGLHADSSLAGFRCLYCERVDNLAICRLGFSCAAERVVQLAGSLCVVIVKLR